MEQNNPNLPPEAINGLVALFTMIVAAIIRSIEKRKLIREERKKFERNLKS